MWIGIVGVSISVVLTIIYLIVVNKAKPQWSMATRFFATMAYIITALMSMYFFENKFNMAFVYIIIALIIALVADLAIEEKDRPQTGDFMMKASAGLCVAFKVANLIAIFYLISSKVTVLNVVYNVLIGIAFSILTIVVLKYVLKLDMRDQTFNALAYFIVAGFMTSTLIWFSILIPGLWAYAVFGGLILINDLLLINVNFGVKKYKFLIYNLQRIAYYLGLVMLIYYLYYHFPLHAI